MLTTEQQNPLAPKAPYILPKYDGPQLPQAHGILVLHKPKGPTSARCLSLLKRMGQKKIGHAGTLDPMAEGVLLVLLGHATKISGHLLTDGNKIYSGTVQLGQQTDTWDAEGQVVAESAWEHIDEPTLHAAFNAWLGVSEQTVPPYSAAKHQGQPLYKLARAGKETPVKKKLVEISQMEVLDVRLPFARFRVECSSGTYIRSLAHSLGMRLGCGAVLTELTREYSHPCGLDQAHTLEALMAEPWRLQEWIMPITRALPHWPVVKLTAIEEEKLKNGTPLPYRQGEHQEDIQGLKQENTPAALEQDAEKAILLSSTGTPLALAEKKLLTKAPSKGKGSSYTDAAEPMWTVLRGLWTPD